MPLLEDACQHVEDATGWGSRSGPARGVPPVSDLLITCKLLFQLSIKGKFSTLHSTSAVHNFTHHATLRQYLDH